MNLLVGLAGEEAVAYGYLSGDLHDVSDKVDELLGEGTFYEVFSKKTGAEAYLFLVKSIENANAKAEKAGKPPVLNLEEQERVVESWGEG